MAFDFETLEPRIHQILSAPGTDLTTISAKRVRRQLVDPDLNLTADFLKENKEAVDAIISSVFERISGGQGAEPETEVEEEKPNSRKRKQDDDGDAEEEEDDDGDSKDDTVKQSPPPPKKAKKSGKNGRELSDAELARKLSSEINGRSTRTGTKGRGSAPATKKGGRAKKSAATVDSDDDTDDGSSKKKTKKKSSPSAGGAKGGFGKEFALRQAFITFTLYNSSLVSDADLNFYILYSEPLAALVQVEKLSRPQVVKQLWVYIKEHELQNPKNKREILCDPSMRAVFNVDKIDMFTMNKVLGQ